MDTMPLADVVKSAEIACGKKNYARARKQFLQALRISPDHLMAKIGYIYSSIRYGKIEEAEKVLSSIQEKEEEFLDDISRFRLFYSRIRILETKGQIEKGKTLIDEEIIRFPAALQTPIKMEKAMFLAMEKRYNDAYSLMMECKEEMADDIREEFLGRDILILLQIDRGNEAIRHIKESIRTRITIRKILLLLITYIFYKPIIVILLFSLWLLLWILLPVTTNTIILAMFMSIILGAVAVLSFVKKKKQTGILALLILLSTLSLFLVKEGRYCFMAAIIVMVVLSQIYINSYKHAAQEK